MSECATVGIAAPNWERMKQGVGVGMFVSSVVAMLGIVVRMS